MPRAVTVISSMSGSICGMGKFNVFNIDYAFSIEGRETVVEFGQFMDLVFLPLGHFALRMSRVGPIALKRQLYFVRRPQ